jgi:cyclic pyranopterin phosphate synthase
MALDRFGRRIHYLRIGLTDHCDMRCIYCMPEDVAFRPSAELMKDDEIIVLVQLMASLGFDKIRLTGGEPTLRANIVEIVKGLAATPGIRSLSMTTNGMRLGKLAQPLAQAGLQRVNVSLDTLDPRHFRQITRCGSLEKAWQGILAAESAGLTPLKINAVVVRGFNQDDVIDLARLSLEHPWQVRFIEMMPFAGATELQVGQAVKAGETLTAIQAALGPLELLNGGKLDGEALVYRIPGSMGEIGFISSVTAPFCAACSRTRLTADGKLRLCLLRDREVDLLTPLRAGASQEELRQLILEGMWQKPWGHGLVEGEFAVNRTMNEIGG